MATTKKKRLWERERSWRLRQLRQQYSEIDAAIDALLETCDPQEGTPVEFQTLSHKLAAVEEDIEWVLFETLVARAHRWRVYVSREPKNLWVRTSYRKRLILTPQAQHDIRERIWHRKVTVIGIMFGVSSVVQAVYAVLSFHLHR